VNRRRRAYTTAEVLISSFLAIGLSAIVSVTLVSTSRTTGDTVTDTKIQQESRALTEVLGQFLRSAKPLGRCLDLQEDRTGGCKVVKEEEHPFVLASPPSSNTLAFYSYTNVASTSGASAEGYAPDLVKITVLPVRQDCTGEGCYALKVTLLCNSESTTLDGAVCRSDGAIPYTSPNASATLAVRSPQVSRVIYVSDPNPFTYLDSEGEELCGAVSDPTATICTAAELASIAVVKIANTAPSSDSDEPQPQPLLIPLPSRGFRG
jgi:hypothetical protein